MQPTDLLDRLPSTLANSVHDETPQPFNRIVSQPEPGVTVVEPIRFLHTTDKDGVVISDTDGEDWPRVITLSTVIKWLKMANGRWVATLHPEQKGELRVLLSARLSRSEPLHALLLTQDSTGTLIVHYRLATACLAWQPLDVSALPAGLTISHVSGEFVTMRDNLSAWESQPTWLIGAVKS